MEDWFQINSLYKHSLYYESMLTEYGKLCYKIYTHNMGITIFKIWFHSPIPFCSVERPFHDAVGSLNYCIPLCVTF